MKEAIRSLIRQMTLEEKASLLSGLDNWHTKPLERLGIPALLMTDGPHGLRLNATPTGVPAPATCFPTAAGLASSWSTSLLETIGQAIGDECRTHDVGVLLGPAINIKRSPLCGRNFEYYSEDPYLAGSLAASFVKGVQSRGVGACLKHFALNNMETRRQNSDSVCDMRTMREIYLAAFEKAVKEASPWTMMCSYNRINGVFASDNRLLMNDILREEWGFDGLVMTDWGALNDRIAAINAGVELEMPASDGATDRAIADAVRAGDLEEPLLDRAVERVLEMVRRTGEAISSGPAVAADLDAHHRLARRATCECMVLLQNKDSLLPLASGTRVAVIGPFAQAARVQGGGSSHVPGYRVDSPLEEIRRYFPDATFCQGCDAQAGQADPELTKEAVDAAAAAEVAVLFLGLPDSFESEGYDRKDLAMPAAQTMLVEAVAAVRPNTVVILMNGSPVEIPWADRVGAILEAYLGGDAAGGAIADILSGAAAPSGHLAETFPLCVEHNPSYLNFPDEDRTVHYAERVFVGYRYYTTCRQAVLFPFGHGLTYTSFAYSGLRLSQIALLGDETLAVQCRVRNTGTRAGQEVVQLYISPCPGPVRRPERELKGFAKVELEPGEEKIVEFQLDKRSFARFDEAFGGWRTDNGIHTVRIGSSCADIRIEAGVAICSTDRPAVRVDEYSTFEELLSHPDIRPLIEAEMEKFSNRPDESLEAMGAGFWMAILLSTPLRVMARQTDRGLSSAWMEDLLARCRAATHM